MGDTTSKWITFYALPDDTDALDGIASYLEGDNYSRDWGMTGLGGVVVGEVYTCAEGTLGGTEYLLGNLEQYPEVVAVAHESAKYEFPAEVYYLVPGIDPPRAQYTADDDGTVMISVDTLEGYINDATHSVKGTKRSLVDGDELAARLRAVSGESYRKAIAALEKQIELPTGS